ncbi:MAG: hypothetical protein QOD38_2460 [Acidimicrobiaceae bacterium]
MTVLSDRVRAVMEAHWQPEGYTVPNAISYPFAWLWDSCFHAVIWAALGDDTRALAELAHVFRRQDERSGFVPHVDYQRDPEHLRAFWGQSEASTITQPPMYGHAIAELQRHGIPVPDEVIERAVLGVEFFLRDRRHRSGLIAITHPWETGCDDSPRFDHWGADDVERWYAVKGALVTEPEVGAFDCAPVSLSALVAWNGALLDVDTDELVAALAVRWDTEARTWVDAGASEHTSGRARTLEALLPLLVIDQPGAIEQVGDVSAFGAPFGPRGVHRDEPSIDGRRYWRGPVWPQLAYLLWLAGADVAEASVRGASASGLAEYWDADDGTGLGAIPQSWSGLMLLMET